MKNILYLLIIFSIFTSCNNKEDNIGIAKNELPYAIMILPEIGCINEVITIDMSRSSDDKGIIGTSYAIDNGFTTNVPFTTDLSYDIKFTTAGIHSVTGFAHDEEHWRGVSTKEILILDKTEQE